MRVRYSPRANADIIGIADYLTERNPAVARAMEQAIRAAVDLIGEFSGAGRAVDQRPNVRVMPVRRYPYLIYYTVRAGELVILHIRHGARAPVKPEEL